MDSTVKRMLKHEDTQFEIGMKKFCNPGQTIPPKQQVAVLAMLDPDFPDLTDTEVNIFIPYHLCSYTNIPSNQ